MSSVWFVRRLDFYIDSLNLPRVQYPLSRRAERGGEASVSTVKIKRVTRKGPPITHPGIWYTDEQSRDHVYTSALKQVGGWAYKTLENYRTGVVPWTWGGDSEFDEGDDDNNPERIWYGVVLDLEPEVNEFGPIIP
jgi:hypothetical protein